MDKRMPDGLFGSDSAEPLIDFLARYRGGADWVGFLERRRGILGRLFHGPQKNVEFDVMRLIDAVLSASELIFDVRWHYDESGSL
jgi:hypothetical protein